MKSEVFQQFQEVNFQGSITSEINLEKFRREDKELVLIAAPAEFDVGNLKGQVIVPNGVISIGDVNDNNDETADDGNGMLWNIEATESKAQKNMNVMLPKIESKKYELGPNISCQLEVYKSFNVPAIKYPKVSKKIKKLHRPDDLPVRWEPFGANAPLTDKESNTFAYKKNKSNGAAKRIIEIARSEELVEKPPKKKKKRKSKIQDEDDNEIETNDRKHSKGDGDEEESSSPVKRKKKKKKNKD
ncbi:probable H/ACA ribonucleoprotein complex subunit 4 [Clytia hemisphaerica]|uniref:Uncharacterized protein n=1 Tax=Clytia hemisphaerica TaxID=252671 RepID=A0A7M5ULQ0_9CNID